MKQIDGISCFSNTEGLTKMLTQTDYLINLLPNTSATQDLLNYQTLGTLKKGAYVINVGRGQTLVDEDLIVFFDFSSGIKTGGVRIPQEINQILLNVQNKKQTVKLAEIM